MDNVLQKVKAFIGLEDEGTERDGGGTVATKEREDVARDPDTGLLRFRSTRRNSSGAPELEMFVFEPKVYEESLQVSGRLRNGCPVIINLKYLDPDEGTRLIDFVCGAAYAIDGHMMRIGDSIFLFTPNNIVITGYEGKNQIEQEVTADRETFFQKK